MKLLGICIPTYNRKNLLNQCLNSIVSQSNDELDVLFDIVVYDNCSQDGTEDFILNKQSQIKNLKYVKQVRNFGPDYNFYSILKNKDYKYIHIISDDDLYSNNSLKSILCSLGKGYEIDFAYLNIYYFKGFKFDDKNVYRELSKQHQSMYGLSKRKLIKIINNELSFLSGMVFNSKYDYSLLIKHNNTHWLQSYCFLQSTSSSKNTLAFLGDSSICKRDNLEKQGYDSLEVFGNDYIDLIDFSITKAFYPKFLMLSLLKSRLIKLVYNLKIQRSFSNSDFKKINKYCRQHFTLFPVFLAEFCPYWFCNFVHSQISRVRKSRVRKP